MRCDVTVQPRICAQYAYRVMLSSSVVYVTNYQCASLCVSLNTWRCDAVCFSFRLVRHFAETRKQTRMAPSRARTFAEVADVAELSLLNKRRITHSPLRSTAVINIYRNCLSICLSVCRSVGRSVGRSFGRSIDRSIDLSIYLSIYISI